jgi:hypothetical protein
MIKRRWNVHMAWFAIVLAAGMASFYGGAYSTGWAMTQIVLQGQRIDSFGDVSGGVRLLTRNDPTLYRQFAVGQLRDAAVHLGIGDSDGRCSDNQRRTLSHAGAWFKEHPDRDPVYAPLQDLLERGLRACDQP